MLNIKQGDLIKVTKNGLSATVGEAGEGGKYTTVYLNEGEHLLVHQTPVLETWEDWHSTRFVRLKTNELVSIVVSANVDFVYCFTTIDGFLDLYHFKLVNALEIIPR